MRSLFSHKSSPKVVTYFALGLIAIQGFSFCGALRMDAWSQEAKLPDSQELQTATEAQIQQLWSKLQAESVELEAVDPRAAITLYQKFFDQGAKRFSSVGIPITLRIANLWQIDLADYHKAIETYDFALGIYKNGSDVVPLQRGRLLAEQADSRAQAAQGKTGALSPQALGAPTLAVPAPQSTTKQNLGVSVPSSTRASGAELEVSISPSTSSNKKPLDISLSSTNSLRRLSVAAPHVAFSGNALSWRPGADRSVTALAQQQDGTLWVATENSGVWRYNPSAARVQDRWHQFTGNDGLKDDSIYALAVDRLNRVWAGTLNHGVSVWNGKAWKNYDVQDGPLGERVFALKTCPTDGDVWLATNAGLTRYSLKNDSWKHITRGEGLPSNQIQAIAFDKAGNIVLGTQFEGVAFSQAEDGYKKWQVVKGPDQMPLNATGKGLPSSLINDVLVARDGTIYAATTAGLAWSADQGVNWSYARGQDYAAKIRGLYSSPSAEWKEQPGAVLAEDYVSCLAQDEAGRIWLGYWQAGYEMVQMQKGSAGLTIKEVAHHSDSGLVRAILPQSKGALLLARYDEGLSYGYSDVNQDKVVAKSAVAGVVVASVSSFPTEAKAPSLVELNALLFSLSQIKPLAPTSPFVTELDEDWRTQGDWLGRYGRYWASLNAMVPSGNYLWGGGWTPVDHAFGISPKQEADALRYFVSWVQTNNPRSLEMPPVYFDSRLQMGIATKDQSRRQAELDDHGEDYPLSKEGPNIYFSVNVPRGLWTLSFYNTNKDGHDGLNRLRDYRYSIRSHDPTAPIENVTDFYAQPELVHSRQHDFFGGVYKRFLVRGPKQLTVEIAKNNSFNTMLAGAFLDLVDEQPPPYFDSVENWQKRQNAREQEHEALLVQNVEKHSSRFAPASDGKDAANRLFIEVERLRELNPLIWAQRSRPIYEALARWIEPALLQASPQEKEIFFTQQATCLYNLMRYHDWENAQRRLGLRPARDVEKLLKWDGQSSYSGKGHETIRALFKATALNETSG